MLRIALFALLALRAVVCTAQSRPSAQERQLLDMVNRERVRARLARLEWNDALATAARNHAKLLAEHRALSHQFPGEPSLAERLGATGLRFDSSAENVALGPGVEASHEGLMQSVGHRANLLNAEYNAIGIGIVERGATLYVAENFGHVFAAYSEAEFRDALTAALNRARRVNGVAPVIIRLDDRLRESACGRGENTGTLVRQLPGVSEVAAFTISDPEKLASPMEKAARASNIRSVSLGVCFRPGAEQGYANFRVVAAFY